MALNIGGDCKARAFLPDDLTMFFKRRIGSSERPIDKLDVKPCWWPTIRRLEPK
jgi:hypothetical protein